MKLMSIDSALDIYMYVNDRVGRKLSRHIILHYQVTVVRVTQPLNPKLIIAEYVNFLSYQVVIRWSHVFGYLMSIHCSPMQMEINVYLIIKNCEPDKMDCSLWHVFTIYGIYYHISSLSELWLIPESQFELWFLSCSYKIIASYFRIMQSINL